MRSAIVVEATSRSPAAGSDESPYERPSPRDRCGVRAVSARRSSECRSTPGTTGARPHPARVDVFVEALTRLNSTRVGRLRPGGRRTAAQLLDQGRATHAEQLRGFLLVATRLRQCRVDVRVLDLPKHG